MLPQGACPSAAGVTGRRPEGTEPAKGAVDWREAKSYTLDFCPVRRRLKTLVLFCVRAEPPGDVSDPSKPWQELVDSCWQHHESPRESLGHP